MKTNTLPVKTEGLTLVSPGLGVDKDRGSTLLLGCTKGDQCMQYIQEHSTPMSMGGADTIPEER